MNTIRIGIVGLGGAARQMAPAFVKHGGFIITAGADVDTNALAAYERDFGAAVSRDAGEVCTNPNVDAVYIATPNHLHTPHTLMALRHGKHVVLEKPMALSMDDALAMCRAADDKALQFIINEPYSFTPALRAIRDIVLSGDYGQLRMAHSWIYNDWLYRPRTPEELNPELGGGVLYRQGPHQFDLLRMIGGGMVRTVRGAAGTWDPSRPVPGSYSVFMDFEDGAVATAVYNGYDRLHTVDFTLRGGEENPAVGCRDYARSRRALLKARSPEEEEAAKRARRYGSGWSEPPGGGNLEWHFTGLTVASCDGCDLLLSPEGLFLMTNEESRQLPLPPDVTGRDSIAAQLYDAVVHDRAPGSTGWWGAATLEVSLAAIQSTEERREIALAHQRPPYQWTRPRLTRWAPQLYLPEHLGDAARPRQRALRRDRGKTLAGPEYTYDHWIDSLGLPLYTGFYIEDLRTLELAWWEQRQCGAAFVKLMGQEGVCEARVTEIPPGKTLPPLKMAVDEIVYVVEGNGLASVWAGDGPRKPFEWQKFSMFMLPRHCWSQLSNMQGDKPARLLHYNFLPLAMTTIPDPDFFINNAHESPQRLYGREEFYSQAKITTEEAGIFKLVKPTDVLWSGNFFPDMRAWDKFTPFWGRGAGGQTIFVHFPDSEMDIHMSIFSEGTYKKAHRHGPGRVIVIPAGEGYSIMWEEGKEKIVVPWHEASMFVPPGQWFHQHFNTGADPARYLALRPPLQFSGYEGEKVKDRKQDQIEYPHEEHWIRQKFEDELASRGMKSAMPREAYEDPAYEWDYQAAKTEAG